MKHLVLAFCCLISLSAVAADFKVRVDAGKTARHATPVSVDVKLGSSIGKGAKITSEGKTTAGQVEDLGDKKGRVWWIVSDLAAGTSRTYEITITDAKGVLPGSFSWKDSSGDGHKSTDLLRGDRPILRFMHTPFAKDNIELTKKPFHHVFSMDGKRTITKGAGGLFPHHRGIYFGYSKCRVGGKSYDTWHAHKGEHQVHEEVLKSVLGPVRGGHVVRILWNDRDGKTFAAEDRGLFVYAQPNGQHLVELTSTLRATDGPVHLGGDRQHAGVQFRAAQDVAKNQKATRYLRPEKWKELAADQQINSKEHKDLPWNAVQYPLGDTRYTVAYLSDPANPGNADFSERLYGRFGEYFPWDLTKDNPLTVRYRWWITTAGEVSRGDVAARYEDLASPPKVTLEK